MSGLIANTLFRLVNDLKNDIGGCDPPEPRPPPRDSVHRSRSNCTLKKIQSQGYHFANVKHPETGDAILEKASNFL